MAGIGFSLTQLLNRNSIISKIVAYSVSASISCGPLLIAILSIYILGTFILYDKTYQQSVTEFQLSITYLIAFSMIFSSPLQISFPRFLADEIYLNRQQGVIPSLNGTMLVMTVCASVIAFIVGFSLFPAQSLLFKYAFIAIFVILCNLWIIVSLLTGLKNYGEIVRGFISCYALILSLAYWLRDTGLSGFMLSYLIGHVVLFLILLRAIHKEYPTNLFINFSFFNKNKMHTSLVWSSIYFNLGIWIDKFIFWFTPSTSESIIGPFRGSIVYDDAIFIAYLFAAPGITTLLLCLETFFSEYYEKFHQSIMLGAPLNFILMLRDRLSIYAFDVVLSVAKIQFFIIVITIQYASKILEFFKIAEIYSNLLLIDVIGTSFQIVFMSALTLLYYMDKRMCALRSCQLLFVLNTSLSILSIYLGPYFYGLGFTITMMCSSCYVIYLLNREFIDLDHKVIMMHD